MKRYSEQNKKPEKKPKVLPISNQKFSEWEKKCKRINGK